MIKVEDARVDFKLSAIRDVSTISRKRHAGATVPVKRQKTVRDGTAAFETLNGNKKIENRKNEHV